MNMGSKAEVGKEQQASKQQQQMFELMGSMAYGNPMDISISKSKAFDMFNRAATMTFPRGFPSGQPQDIGKLAGYGGSGYDQQQQQQSMQANTNKAHDMSGAYGVSQQHHQQQQGQAQQQQQAHQPKVNQSSSGPYDQRSNVQQQSQPQQQQHQGNMDLNTGYKSFGGTPSSTLMDPALRNLASLSSLYQPEAGYYDKNMPPAAHSLFKSSGGVPSSATSSSAALQQIFNNSMATTMAYNAAAGRDQQGMYGGNYHHQAAQQKAPLNVPSVQPTPPVEKPKRGRKKKQDPQELLQQQQQQQQQAAHQQAHQHQQQPNPAHQGFQSYSGMKTAQQPPSSSSNQQSGASSSSSNANAEPSAISLKTAANVLQGSAFNFGPGPAGLGLPTSLYGENSPYLDEFRSNPTNAYPYLPSSHRGPSAAAAAASSGAVAASDGTDKSINPASSSAAAVPSPYHQFLSHPSSRPSPYQFMNQLDPLHQQYIRQEELRAQMMLNQSLGLGAPGAHAPPGAYGGQPGAYHPALGMHKTPYDAMNTMNRPPWI